MYSVQLITAISRLQQYQSWCVLSTIPNTCNAYRQLYFSQNRYTSVLCILGLCGVQERIQKVWLRGDGLMWGAGITPHLRVMVHSEWHCSVPLTREMFKWCFDVNWRYDVQCRKVMSVDEKLWSSETRIWGF